MQQAAMAAGGAVLDPNDPGSMEAAQTLAMQSATQFEPREWCVEKTSSGRYVARVLGWLPQ
jgi:surface antigen